jgi:acyl carrier protein
MKDEIFNRVKSFVIKQAAVNEDEVTEDTSIENDLVCLWG